MSQHIKVEGRHILVAGFDNDSRWIPFWFDAVGLNRISNDRVCLFKTTSLALTRRSELDYQSRGLCQLFHFCQSTTAAIEASQTYACFDRWNQPG